MQHDALLTRVHAELEYRDGALYWRKSKAGRRVWQQAGRTTARHREVMLDGVIYGTHSLVWLIHHGVLPSMIDHINRDPTDNHIENLRLTDHCTNNWNKTTPAHNTSGHKHIVWEAKRNRWVGSITSNGVQLKKCSIHLERVIAWRDTTLQRIRGDFNPT